MTRLDGLRSSLLLLRGHLRRFRQPGLQDLATATLRTGPGRRPWVLALINATLRARRAATYLFVLRPRSGISRLQFERASRRGTPVAPQTISLLCPTRGRVALTRAFARSAARTAADPARVRVMLYVDDDDPDLARYRTLVASASMRHCTLMVGPPIGVAAAWNVLAAAADSDLLAMANDDQLFVTHGWDVRLDAAFADARRTSTDAVCCLYFEAGQYPDGTADFPILSRAWYETLGYFTPEIFAQWEVETWIFDLARRVERLIPVPGVLVEHRHYQDYKAPFDATYQRHRLTREKSFADHGLFLRTVQLRDEDARRLHHAIHPRAGITVVPGAGPWYVAQLTSRLPALRAELETSVAAHGGDDPRRIMLYRRGVRRPGNEAHALLSAVLAEIPEASTHSPGEVVLQVLPASSTVPATGRCRGSRLLVGLRTDGPVRLEPGHPGLPDGGFVLLPDAAPLILHNDSRAAAAVLIIDVPSVDV